MKMKPQYQTRYELLHESYQKWLTGFTRHAVSWGVCHPNIYYFHNLTPGWVSFNGEKPEIAIVPQSLHRLIYGPDTRTLAVYVTTQQLHRLSVVQGMLKHIDFSTASPTVRLALQKGTGAGNISALNKVMKGTLVTSLALVAVTTGPDMIKMLRGRISGAQFIRNLAVASSGVAGGAVGSVAGGILFSPLGPFGALTGRVVGGVLGGMIASAVSGKIAGALVEEDRVKILAMIQEQVTWLAGSFLLTGHEIENLNENLARVIDQNALEIIFAAGIQQRAATNMLIKPLVVSIIRQRPVMEYDASHLGNMVNRLEEALPPELPA
ncbi:hypothetical protein E5S36_21540 [Escherichia coli]|nr:hypothetical protein E5S36_21540 [Escherichia coli]